MDVAYDQRMNAYVLDVNSGPSFYHIPVCVRVYFYVLVRMFFIDWCVCVSYSGAYVFYRLVRMYVMYRCVYFLYER